MLRSVVNENFIDIPKVYVPAYSDGPPPKEPDDRLSSNFANILKLV